MGNPSVVACITDFGTSDYFTGALHGVLASLLPGAPVVDITHEIPAGDIRRAAIVMWEAQPAFPDGTVFLVVVDPGVGSARRPAAFRFPRCGVVCPDNGITTFLIERFPDFDAVEIDPQRVTAGPISNTFHGRDLFAPAAARLYRDGGLRGLGSALLSPVMLPLPLLRGEETTGWDGEILYIDHFGNAVTSIGRISHDGRSFDPWLRTEASAGTIPANSSVLLSDGTGVPLRRTYTDAKAESGAIALVGGSGLLEIASWNRPAGGGAALQPGAVVRLKTIE
ncbi:MAG: SAM-dependent chlorinase/fluorinase [Anaerolineales bacterium]